MQCYCYGYGYGYTATATARLATATALQMNNLYSTRGDVTKQYHTQKHISTTDSSQGSKAQKGSKKKARELKNNFKPGRFERNAKTCVVASLNFLKAKSQTETQKFCSAPRGAGSGEVTTF